MLECESTRNSRPNDPRLDWAVISPFLLVSYDMEAPKWIKMKRNLYRTPYSRWARLFLPHSAKAATRGFPFGLATTSGPTRPTFLALLLPHLLRKYHHSLP